MLNRIIILLITLTLLSCSPEQPSQSTAQAATTPQESVQPIKSKKVANYKLLFFINPAGGPCQMQGNILAEMAEELKGKVVIQPLKTTVKTDLDTFYAYGIRALPTLILADLNGKEIQRLPPGVQPATTIRNLIAKNRGQ